MLDATKTIPTVQATQGRPPLSPGHGTSLSTTAGITSVITGVMAAIFGGQTPPMGTPGPAGVLAGTTVGMLMVGATGLYLARNAVCQAMDEGNASWPKAPVHAARALVVYHLGMAAVFAGLAFAAAWRIALPHGLPGWLGVGIAGLITIRALVSARGWYAEMSRRQSTANPT